MDSVEKLALWIVLLGLLILMAGFHIETMHALDALMAMK